LSLLERLFGCKHKRFSFPQTRRTRGKRAGIYVCCLSCGSEFEYDWNEWKLEHEWRKVMDIQEQIEKAKAMDGGCYERAKARGEQTFTLVAQDHSSPRVICEWIKENIETCPAEKLVDALLDAIAMRSNPNRKAAD